MGVLQDYSLVHRNADVKTLAVHRLVQIVLQDSMQPAEQEEWIKRISSALDKTFPQIEPTTTTCNQCDRLILHILACTSHPQSLKIISSDLASLLFKTAWFLYMRAEFTQAEKFFNRALQNWEQVFGAESLHVASALNSLATLGVLQDKYAKSEQYFLRALRIYEQNPDSQLPDIATLLTNLAVLYSDTGQFTKAESLFFYAYSIFAQILGTAHVATALPLSGLANLYFQQAEYQDAEMLYEQRSMIKLKMR